MTDPRRELEDILTDVAATIDRLDLAAPDAEAGLERAHPFLSPGMGRIRELCEDGIREDWLVPRQAGPDVRFGRLSRDLGGYIVDAVLLSGAGKGHTHRSGEVTIGFAREGEKPLFDGRPEGWVICAPGSHHVPTVVGGAMLLVYFTKSEVEWD